MVTMRRAFADRSAFGGDPDFVPVPVRGLISKAYAAQPMDDFASKPNSPDGFGLIQGENNAIAPRKRPLSSMTPTILTRKNKLFLVVGSPGGPTIINTVLQVIMDVVDHHLTLAQAIAAPRLHHQWLPDLIRSEPGAVLPKVRSTLEAEGHLFAPDAGVFPGSLTWGDAEGIFVDPTTGNGTGHPTRARRMHEWQGTESLEHSASAFQRKEVETKPCKHQQLYLRAE